MSRIAKKPIVIPQDVKSRRDGDSIFVIGPKGELSLELTPLVKLEETDGELLVSAVNNTRFSRAASGLTRTLINNMVIGVTEGYSKTLEMKGVGFRAETKDKTLELHVGFSHAVIFQIPEKIEIEVKKNVITITGIDKQLVGETAARIRRIKPPEPYKGKGIKYQDEIIRRKVGKAAKSSEGSGK